MKKRVYIVDVDLECPDYKFVKDVVAREGHEITSLENADLCFFTAGTYLSQHNASLIEGLLNDAKKNGKRIVIVKPYGTSYMPLYFRQMHLMGIELLKSQIAAVLRDKAPSESAIVFNRYC